jgi:hypothetical protein
MMLRVNTWGLAGAAVLLLAAMFFLGKCAGDRTMKAHFGNIIVGSVLTILYWFFLLFFGNFYSSGELHLFIPFGILVTILAACIASRDSDTVDHWEFWVPVITALILIVIIAATGAQHKADPIEWLNKK